MRILVPATILLISLSNAMAQAPAKPPRTVPSSNAPVVVPSAAQDSRAQAPAELNIALNTAEQQIGSVEDQARETVLVVPGPDLTPDALAGLTEDMAVMCRIFDKALYPSTRATSAYTYSMRGNDLAFVTRLGGQPSGRTQGLYLDGYGAVFFVQVDFPLVAPQQQKQEAKPEESADRVWSQTMNELRGQEPTPTTANAAPAYDAQKVDNLKATLIKTLRHAANLRLRPEDQVTVVAGSPRQASSTAMQRVHYLFQRSNFGPRPPGTTPAMTNRAENPVPDPAATLILRTVKSDVDALAAGKLAADQFAPKVATLWSWLPPQAPERTPQPATPTPAQR
jgi:hypothetical protein